LNENSFLEKHIYHITHVLNLKNIIQNNGLLCYNNLKEGNYIDIASQDIQGRRARQVIRMGPGGNLHDYVPFFFCKRPPMLYKITKDYEQDVCLAKSPYEVVYLVVKIGDIYEANFPCVFCDGHGIMRTVGYYEDPRDLSNIDWELMESKYWYDTIEDPNRKCRRQAEFLIYKKVPWNFIRGIAVYNNRIKEQVMQLLEKHSIKPEVKTFPDWYY